MKYKKYIRIAKVTLNDCIETKGSLEVQKIWYAGFVSGLLEMASRDKDVAEKFWILWEDLDEIGASYFGGKGWSWKLVR